MRRRRDILGAVVNAGIDICFYTTAVGLVIGRVVVSGLCRIPAPPPAK